MFPLYKNKKNLWVLILDGNNSRSVKDLENQVYHSFNAWFGGSISDVLKSNHRAGFADNITIHDTSITPLRWSSGVVSNRNSVSELDTIPTLPAEAKPIFAKVSFDYRGPDNNQPGWPINKDAILDVIQSPIDDSPPPKDDTVLGDIGEQVANKLTFPLLGVGAVLGLYLLLKIKR